MLITKADGTTEEFEANKLRNSLRKAGAASGEIEHIVHTIEDSLIDGMQTQIIYRRAFELLRKSEKPTAAKYSLRRALFSLGPTGFPFEDFLSRLFNAEGYKTKTRVEIQGKCALHEVDVVAHKPDHSFVVEAKFHARPGLKSDLQVPLYCYARYLDLKSLPSCEEDECGIGDFWIVTNTKFTSAAIKYASCVGLTVLSWNYPKKHTLQERIEDAGLYPVTALSALSNTHKQNLLESGEILCRDILAKPDILRQAGVNNKRIDETLREAHLLCVQKTQ
jgi:hypothetical protein